MRKLLSSLIILPVLVLTVAFLVANRQMVAIGFDPFSTDNPAIAIGPMPLWTALMGALLIGYGLGAYGMWRSGKGGRRRAAGRKKELKALKKEITLAGNEETTSPRTGLTKFLPALPFRQKTPEREKT